MNKYLVLASITFLTVVGFILFTYLNNFNGELIFSVLLAFLMTYFCVLDAKERESRLPWSIYWLIYIFWPIAVPIYLFVSRKGWKKLYLFGYISSYFFICIVGFCIGWLSLPWVAHYAHDKGEYNLAIRLYSSLIDLDPNDAWGYYNRGNAFYAIGFTSESKQDHEIARQLDPSLFENEEKPVQEETNNSPISPKDLPTSPSRSDN